MKSAFALVEEFNHTLIGVPVRQPGTIENEEELGFLIGSLQEEVDEFDQAAGQDFIAEIDSLIDLIYFAMGGLVRMGIPSEASEKIFIAVHEANMQKVKGRKDRPNGSCDLDAVKPEGWVSPEERIMEILEQYQASINVDAAS